MIEVKNIKLDTAVLDKFIAQSGMSDDQALRATAFQIEGWAKSMAPVKTGALKGSIKAQKIADKHYYVQDGVLYGIFQELGTRFMAAHPFLIPAFEKARDYIVEAVKKELDKIK